MKCIYCLKTVNDNVTFNSQEHIFSASLGGKTKLPHGFVCDTCNTKILSSMELKFIKTSLLSIIREFEGPGKRGSLNNNNASKSEIHLLINTEKTSEYGLGYLSKGIPKYINQFVYKADGTIRIILSIEEQNSIDKSTEKMRNNILQFKEQFYFIGIEESEYTGDSLISYYKGKYYIAERTREKAIEAIKILKEILNKNHQFEKTKEEYKKIQTTSHQKITLDLNNDPKVITKIGFNLLSYIQGHDYILNTKFDSTRNYIINQSNEQRDPNINANNFDEKFKSLFPKDSHVVLLSNHENKTYVTISFYGFQINYGVELFPFKENVDCMGLIVDWRNEKDYLFKEHLKLLRTRKK